MDLNIFRAIEVILRNYARQPVKKLIDHYLNIKIVLKVNAVQTSSLLSHVELPPHEKAVFNSHKKPLLCVVIDHPLNLSLS